MIDIVEKMHLLWSTLARGLLRVNFFIWRSQILIISIDVIIDMVHINNQSMSILGLLSSPGLLSFIKVSSHAIVIPGLLIVIIDSRFTLLSSRPPSHPWQLWHTTAADTLPVATSAAVALEVHNRGNHSCDE